MATISKISFLNSDTKKRSGGDRYGAVVPKVDFSAVDVSKVGVSIDRSLLMCVSALMGIGLVLVYSASFIFAAETYGDSLFFFKRQIFFMFAALGALAVGSVFPYPLLKRFFWFFFAVLILGLLGVFVPGLGHRVGGATRWISIPGGFRLEPGEFAKLMSPVIFAFLLTYRLHGDGEGQSSFESKAARGAPKKSKRAKAEPEEGERALSSGLKFWLMALTVAFLPVLIMLKQPDFGSSVIFISVGLTLLFCFGLPWFYVITAAAVSVPLFYELVMRVPYRRARVEAFLNPWADPGHSGFQVIQSLLSMHAGGFWGVGIGKGQSKLFFLPEAHTDFILSVLGEETGFVGLVLVLSLFAFIVFRGLQIGMRCADPFGRRLAIGFSSLIGFSALINTGVVTGLLPTKGLTMPFLSYGGSSLVAVSLACGVLINIHSRSKV